MLQASLYMSYGNKGVVFSEYGPYWRSVRKLCTLQLLSASKIEYFAPMRREEVGLLVDSLKKAAAARDVVDIILDMIVASFDTSATTIEWTLSELLRHPAAMKRLQDELQTVFGLDKMVEEKDLFNLPYLDMVIKESLRLYPVGPLLLPRNCMEETIIDGYRVPKNARIIVNAWAIGRDPNAWSDNAEEFLPERFADTSIDLRGHDFQLLPFGSGRRGCPGMQLRLTIARFVLAQLVHCFNWELPDGVLPNELDMSEIFGLSMPRANHLVAVPKYRLRV
ncbi:hypothetical protein GH714_027142 [Hevea brasiliensis]|uniref:Cytochrome P450 n=1 Tax=Hevea brasiliensis TaxID=3981 RepID=A0A6A6LBE7_HEVBR|nr:hypothetical protein GH714_027142 [Hevea brasiliensis]